MNIRELIKKKGYTQAEFAQKLGQTRENIARQLDKPSYPTLVKFAEALDVPIWQLFISPEDAAKEIRLEQKKPMGIVYDDRFIEVSSLEELLCIAADLVRSNNSNSSSNYKQK